MEEALEIGVREKVKKGIEPMMAELGYSGGLKKYVWTVGAFLTRVGDGSNAHGEADTLMIDALTSEIISHEITYCGPLR